MKASRVGVVRAIDDAIRRLEPEFIVIIGSLLTRAAPTRGVPYPFALERAGRGRRRSANVKSDSGPETVPEGQRA